MTNERIYNQENAMEYLEKVKACLPNEYLVSDECELYYDGMKIANFIPLVLKKMSVISVHTGEMKHKVMVSALRVGQLQPEKEIDIAMLDSFDYQQQISNSLWVNCLNKDAKRIFTFALRRICAEAEEVEVYTADRIGWFNVNGHRGYVTGDGCIGKPNINIRVSEKLKEYKLVPKCYSKVFDSGAVEQYLKDLIALNRRLAPVFLAGDVLAITSKLFEEAGYPVKFSLYARGEQSTGKTTLVTHACSFFKREEDVEAHLHNLTATDAKLNKVLDCQADSVIVIDDLRRSDSLSNIRHQERVLDGLIRVAANKVGRETMLYENEVRGFCVFIGEYALRTPSTNNRIVLLNFSKNDLNKAQLVKVMREPERLSLFIQWFIEWVLQNYDALVSQIKRCCEEYYKFRSKQEQDQERLRSHGNALQVAYALLAGFCDEKSWELGFSVDEFARNMENIITEQIECLELECNNRPDYIFEMFLLVQQELDYQDSAYIHPSKTNWNQTLYLDEDRGLIYLPSETVENLLERAKAQVTVRDIMDDFQISGLLNVDKSKNGSRTKKLAGKRCYVISYDVWKSHVRDIIEADDSQR